MKPCVKLFTDRAYVIEAVFEQVSGLSFVRTGIEKIDVEVTKSGTLYALTPSPRPQAASQEAALKNTGFTKVDVPEVQLFQGEINRVSLFRKEVRAGEQLHFKKLVLLISGSGTALRETHP